MSPRCSDPASPNGSPDDMSRGKRAARIGVGLILLSGCFWFSLFAIPFLPLTVGQKASLAGVDFVAVQIAWWTGAALAGPQVVARLKFWRRKRSSGDERMENPTETDGPMNKP